MEISEDNALKTFLDPVNFAESFIRLETPDGLLEWHLDSYQKKLIRDNSRNRVINKSKKTGISTTIAGESIFKAFTNSGRQIIFVSTGQRIAEELLGKWYDMLATLPDALQPHLDKHSMQVARLPNGSRVMSLPSSDPGNIRGFGMRGPMTDVYVDEYAHVANDKELWVVVRDFQILGGHITLNSTPKGRRGKYYEIADPLQTVYQGGNYPKSNWSYHEIPYYFCPRLVAQEKFLKEGMTDIDFNQEYNCQFIDESLAFFPYDLIWANQKVKEFVSPGYSTKNPIYFGIDFGKTTSKTIITVVEEYAPEAFKIIYMEELFGVNYDEQANIIHILYKDFNPTMIKVDASGPGGQAMEDILKQEKYCGNAIYGYDFTSMFKENIIIKLRMLMQRHKVDILSHEMGSMAEELERQLHSIQRTTTKFGMHTRYSGKESGMDDMVWSLCYDKDTEILTKDKWKLIKNITKDDEIATLNPETDYIEYYNPNKLISYRYKGNMVHFKGKSIDLLVTPNHNMYIRKHYSGRTFKRFEFEKAKNLIGKHIKLKRNANWKGINKDFYVIPAISEIPKYPANKYIRPEKQVPMDLWLEFLGYYLSEGNISKNRICIYQSQYYNSDKVKKMRKCLENFRPYVYSIKEHISKNERPMVTWRIYDRQLYLHLKNFGSNCFNKFIPKELKNSTKEKLKVLFDALYLGDGSTNGHVYYTSSTLLRDDVMEVGLKLGKAVTCHIDIGSKGVTYCISISKSYEPEINHHKKYGGTTELEPYDDMVYCLEVPNHLVFTRRNGKTAWCGNCLAVYKEFEFNFNPMFVQVKDPVLQQLQERRDQEMTDVGVVF
jgi:phage FluMu gp28-like protein